MGMRPDLGNAWKSGGGCRSGMSDSGDNPRLAGLRGLEESLRFHREAQAARAPVGAPAAATTPAGPVAPEPEADDHDLFLDEIHDEIPETHPAILRRRRIIPAFLGGRIMRRVFVALAAIVTIAVVGMGALWYALSRGPIALPDFATDRIAAAIKENLGNNYSVDVGGTVLERDENGRTALRIRDIVVK